MKLYIDGVLADWNTDGKLPQFTYQVSDISNPTAVRNSFSTSIDLPGSPNNNRIFECSFMLDRLNNTFNPTKRISFVLCDDSDTPVEKGYVKLNKVRRTKTTNSYNITLYGEIGAWLYKLQYDDEGNELTLNSVNWGVDLGFTINRAVVNDAWNQLREDLFLSNKWQYLNFAPVYGSPKCDSFDPTAVAVCTESYANDRFACARDANTPDYVSSAYWGLPTNILTNEALPRWRTFEDANGKNWGILLPDTEKNLTEFETFDFMSYIMRPVLNVYYLLVRILSSSNHTYKIEINTDLEKRLKKTWVTLKTLYEIKPDVCTGTTFTQEELFAETSAPATYFLNICKAFGMYVSIVFDENCIYLRDRDSYFKNEIRKVTISDNVSITPLNVTAKYYDAKWDDGEDSLSSTYKDKYDKEYGRQVIDTGYNFDSNRKDFMSTDLLKGGIDSTGQSMYYHMAYRKVRQGFDPESKNFEYGMYPSVMGNGNYWCKWRMLLSEDSTDNPGAYGETIDLKANCPTVKTGVTVVDLQGMYDCKLRLNTSWEGYRSKLIIDPVPKCGFTDEDGNESGGADVLLTYNGFVNPALYEYTSNTTTPTKVLESPYILSDDVPANADGVTLYDKMLEGKRCWIDTRHAAVSGVSSQLTNGYPWFARCEYTIDATYTQKNVLDFGAPAEIYVNSCNLDSSQTIYNMYWADYCRDMYSPNIRVIEATVKASDIIRDSQINESFRVFYSIENSIWVLTKIANYTPGDETLTCNFQQVGTIQDYKSDF